jgi:molybdenum cofactor cytidylyltransferase
MLSLIVLAAGKSSRMRGRNKLLAKIGGKPMIRRVVESAVSSMVDEVIVVVGWEANKIMDALTNLPCRCVVNKDFRTGQSSSVKAGLREITDSTEAILVLPGDVALINAHSINMVVKAYKNRKSPIVVAAHSGRSGHPILLSRELFNEIERIDEATFGLKSVVNRHESEVQMVETGSENVLRDVDTPEDLKLVKQ